MAWLLCELGHQPRIGERVQTDRQVRVGVSSLASTGERKQLPPAGVIDQTTAGISGTIRADTMLYQPCGCWKRYRHLLRSASACAVMCSQARRKPVPQTKFSDLLLTPAFYHKGKLGLSSSGCILLTWKDLRNSRSFFPPEISESPFLIYLYHLHPPLILSLDRKMD